MLPKPVTLTLAQGYASELPVPEPLLVVGGIPQPLNESVESSGVEMRNTGTMVQWKYVDESDDEWRDVIAVDDITGPQGEQGVQGTQGIQGFIGPTGLTGATGSTGATGPEGPAGTVGTILGSYETLEALQGAHPVGTPGDFYLVEGDLYVWSEDDSQWVNVGQLQGPQGPMGPQGPVGAHVEFDNDGEVLSWRSVGDTEWTLLVELEDLVGPQGLQGIQGVQGVAGAVGATGPTGPTGATGAAGQSIQTYFDGTAQSGLVEAVATGTSSGGNVVFSATTAGVPIFNSISAASAVVTSWGVTAQYVFGAPTLAVNKETITVPIRQVSFNGITVLGNSVLGSVGMVNPPSAVTCTLRILGSKYVP